MSAALPADGIILDILGQQPLLKIYTQICIFYATDDNTDHNALITTLQHGLARLHAAFPWTAGQVVITDAAAHGSSGTVRIAPLAPARPLVVSDLRQGQGWSLAALERARFPFGMLDEAVLCPRTTLPLGGAGEADVVFPVLEVQATLLDGGLALAVLAHHAAMDVTGQGVVMGWLARACRGEAFLERDLVEGNGERTAVVRYLDDEWVPGTLLDHQIAPSVPRAVTAPAHCIWAYFAFSADGLAALKAEASQALSAGMYVSTDDALTAFIWQSTMRARQHRLEADTKITLARAVDTRSFLNLPATYPGLMQNMTYHSYPLQDVIKQPLGSIASALRAAVDLRTSTLQHDTRALATLMHRSADKTRISFTASLNTAVDLMLSSWAKVDCHTLDFGLGLGLPRAVRRPQFTPVEGLVYILPKAADGELVVGLCLREEDLEKLRTDGEVLKHATYIG